MNQIDSCRAPRDTLYYDGKCSLCNAEMNKLRVVKNDSLELVDIHTLDEDPSLPSRDELLRSLHLRTAQGSLMIGLDANVGAWDHTPFASRWRLLQSPVIRPFADLAYRLWARWRYHRLYQK